MLSIVRWQSDIQNNFKTVFGYKGEKSTTPHRPETYINILNKKNHCIMLSKALLTICNTHVAIKYTRYDDFNFSKPNIRNGQGIQQSLHSGRVTHICVSKIGNNWYRLWFVRCFPFTWPRLRLNPRLSCSLYVTATHHTAWIIRVYAQNLTHITCCVMYMYIWLEDICTMIL